MRIIQEGITGSFKNINVDRPWGYFGLYSDNEICTSKILYIKKNQSLSLQLHQKRSQFYLLLDDNFLLECSDVPVPQSMIDKVDIGEINCWYYGHTWVHNAHEGSMFGFEKKIIHRIEYVGRKKYGRVLDLAFGENDEKDIIRLDDQYGR